MGGQIGKNNALYLAAANDSLAHVVERLIEGGAEIDAGRAVTGATPLLNAAFHGNADVVERLIAAGADVDKPCKMDDRDTATPLFLAWRCRLTLG